LENVILAQKLGGRRGCCVGQDVLVDGNRVKNQDNVVQASFPKHRGNLIARLLCGNQLFLNLRDDVDVGQQVLQTSSHEVSKGREFADLYFQELYDFDHGTEAVVSGRRQRVRDPKGGVKEFVSEDQIRLLIPLCLGVVPNIN